MYRYCEIALKPARKTKAAFASAGSWQMGPGMDLRKRGTRIKLRGSDDRGLEGR